MTYWRDGWEFENILEYIQWIGKAERWLGHRGTNAFKVFERVVSYSVVSLRDIAVDET